MANVPNTFPTSTSNTAAINNINVPVVNDKNTGECFKQVVSLNHISWLPCLKLLTQQVRPRQSNILAIELPSRVWRPKVLNKYVPIDYSNDIDEGIFDYSHYGKADFSPNVQWADIPRLDLITFDAKHDMSKLDKGLKIGKLVPLTTTKSIWDWLRNIGTVLFWGRKADYLGLWICDRYRGSPSYLLL